jgi:putative glutathione S-transferase
MSYSLLLSVPSAPPDAAALFAVPPHRPGRVEPAVTAPRLRSRLGDGRSGGFSYAPHRYHLYLSASCQSSQRVAIARDLLGLTEVVGATALPVTCACDGGDGADGRFEAPVTWRLPATAADRAVPVDGAADHAGNAAGAAAEGDRTEAEDAGTAALRDAYRATIYRYDGPLTVPALYDHWTGRVVSNDSGDIVRDLAAWFTHGPGVPEERPGLFPRERAEEIRALEELVDQRVTDAARQVGRTPGGPAGAEAARTLLTALDTLEARLEENRYLVGERLTGADVHLWVALAHLDAVHRCHLDDATALRVAEHPRLWAYGRRLHRLPAFRANLRLDAVAARHRRECPGAWGTVPEQPALAERAG